MTEFVRKLREKGWSAKEVARRWGISPRRLSQIAADPSLRDLDALDGLPNRVDGLSVRVRHIPLYVPDTRLVYDPKEGYVLYLDGWIAYLGGASSDAQAINEAR